jgi:hypothetical protein
MGLKFISGPFLLVEMHILPRVPKSDIDRHDLRLFASPSKQSGKHVPSL